MLPPDEHIFRVVKAALRKRMRGIRNAAPLSSCQERSRKIVQSLQTLPEVHAAASVALFWPIEARHEVDLRAFDSSLRARGVRVAYPSIDPETRDMVFRWSASEATMEERGMGFAEPPADAEIARELDVIVAPALAMDGQGYRLGYGAGYYDRALIEYKTAFPIAVGYDYQFVADIPREPHDVPVACVVTDTRVYHVAVAAL
jgi:5-formyltetrahydrofolate cyclo-ligase